MTINIVKCLLIVFPSVLNHRCYTGANCEGSWFPMASAIECCVDTDDGMSFSIDGVCCTLQCIGVIIQVCYWFLIASSVPSSWFC